MYTHETGSVSSFKTYETTLDRLDLLLGEGDMERLSVYLEGVGVGEEGSSSEEEGEDHDEGETPSNEVPPGSGSTTPTTTSTSTRRRIRQTRKLARFFGTPVQGWPELFERTLSVLKEGVEEELEEGGLGRGEGEGLLERLEGLRRRVGGGRGQ